MANKSIQNCVMITLPKVGNRDGFISAVNNLDEIPFTINRIFYLYDIPAGADRGAHAHKECHQILIAASGAFEVEVNDGKEKKIFLLNQPHQALHIPPGIWAAERNFSSGAICLVLASHHYAESDYIREYSDYLNYNL